MTVKTTIYLTEDQDAALERLVKKKIFASKAEAIRDAIRKLLKEYEDVLKED